jgi:hypothetical protein
LSQMWFFLCTLVILVKATSMRPSFLF